MVTPDEHDDEHDEGAEDDEECITVGNERPTILRLQRTKQATTAPPVITTVFVTRHAEKESGNDPALTAAGRARAQTLAHVLGNAGIRKIYTSPARRTQLTAQPLATARGLTPAVIPFPDLNGHVRAIASDIRTHHSGNAVLYVGHSNTGPALITELGGPTVTIEDAYEFDRLLAFVLVASTPPANRLLDMRYGNPTPGP